MEVIAKGKFYRDLANLNNLFLKKEVQKTLNSVIQAKDVTEIQQLRKLRKFDVHYRIKVAEFYRIGIIIRNNKVWFTCFGHRSNFYKNFP